VAGIALAEIVEDRAEYQLAESLGLLAHHQRSWRSQCSRDGGGEFGEEVTGQAAMESPRKRDRALALM
jgi:hypothetical protein